MKAIYNVTGEIVDIEDMSIVTYKESDGTYVKTLIKNFTFIDAEKDYWTRLEHTYAGMAMQGMITNLRYYDYPSQAIIEDAIMYARNLVNKMKEERK